MRSFYGSVAFIGHDPCALSDCIATQLRDRHLLNEVELTSRALQRWSARAEQLLNSPHTFSNRSSLRNQLLSFEPLSVESASLSVELYSLFTSHEPGVTVHPVPYAQFDALIQAFDAVFTNGYAVYDLLEKRL